MADFLSQEKRSALMGRVRNRGTAAELYVRQEIRSAGFRYRLNVRKLPGTPDMALHRYRAAVLVQGCFWHGHDCPKGRRRPSTNPDFWNRKLDGNLARDAANQEKLADMDWTVFVIWECSIKEDTDTLLAYLRRKRAESEPGYEKSQKSSG